MSDNTVSLRRKIGVAGKLRSVVRTMKAVAASSIGQYEESVRALGDYYHIVELGLGMCIRKNGTKRLIPERKINKAVIVRAVVLGSDQGLVGQFNEVIADFAVKALSGFPGKHSI